MLDGLMVRVRALFYKSKVEHDLDQELKYHIEQQTEINISMGMNPDQAHYAALKAFGGVEQSKELSRDSSGVRWIEELWQDLRYGARMLIKHPGITLIIILTLTLGIGANSAIFSVINAVLLKPLPYEDSQQLALVWQTDKSALEKLGIPRIPVTFADFYDWRDQSKSFEGLAALNSWQFNLTGQGEPEKLNGVLTTTNFFSLLRVKPLVGRDFRAEEEREGASKVAILSFKLWQSRFGGVDNAVGRSLVLNDVTHTIIGVMPQHFRFTESSNLPSIVRFGKEVDVWIPIRQTSELKNNRRNHNLTVVARIKDGQVPDQAQAEMSTISHRIAQGFSKTPENFGAEIVTLREQIAGDLRPSLFVLFGAVTIVLLISCANVASLLLVRALSRRKEMAIRNALGADRKRIIRQLLTESLMLATIGGILGTLLAWLGSDLLLSLSPDNVSRIGVTSLDWRVLVFTLFVTLVTGVAFGLWPALASSKSDINESLKEEGRAIVDPRRRALSFIVTAELAMALILLVGAGLLIKSFSQVTQIKPGFNPEKVLSFEISLQNKRYHDPQMRVQFFQQLMDRVKTLPDVQTVGANYALPLSGADPSNGFDIEGRTFPEGNIQSANFGTVIHDYFKALDIPLLRGRLFSETDRSDSPKVVIIDDEMRRRYFPNENPIGKRLRAGSQELAIIVGIVGNIKHKTLEEPPRPYIYVPFSQHPFFWPSTNIVVRSKTGDLTNLMSEVRREIKAVDQNQPISNITSMEEFYSKAVRSQRFSMQLLGALAGLALILSIIGLYSVTSNSIAQRVHEIGVRMALGAQKSDVLKLVIKQGMTLSLIGVAIGLISSFALTRLIRKLLFEVSATDPLTFILISLLLSVVALIACWTPARRAAKVDPIIALRGE